jgi:biotin transport system substrate-specific component
VSDIVVPAVRGGARVHVLADALPGSLVRDVVLVLGGAGLLAASAQVTIPLPFTPVPITGQTFAVLLIGASYGVRRALGTMALYLAIGFAGMPVFSPDPKTGHARTGAQIVHGASFGYIVGMAIAVGLVAWLSSRAWDRRAPTSVAQMALGNVVIYAAGVPWLASVAHLTAQQALTKGLWPFLPGDALKIALAAGLLPAAWRLLPRHRR